VPPPVEFVAAPAAEALPEETLPKSVLPEVTPPEVVDVAVPEEYPSNEPAVQQMAQQAMQQAVVAKRAHRLARKVDEDTKDLSFLVKRQRFERLNYYALKHNWSVDSPPARVSTKPSATDWWQEWRELRLQMVEP